PDTFPARERHRPGSARQPSSSAAPLSAPAEDPPLRQAAACQHPPLNSLAMRAYALPSLAGPVSGAVSVPTRAGQKQRFWFGRSTLNTSKREDNKPSSLVKPRSGPPLTL